MLCQFRIGNGEHFLQSPVSRRPGEAPLYRKCDVLSSRKSMKLARDSVCNSASISDSLEVVTGQLWHVDHQSFMHFDN